MTLLIMSSDSERQYLYEIQHVDKKEQEALNKQYGKLKETSNMEVAEKQIIIGRKSSRALKSILFAIMLAFPTMAPLAAPSIVTQAAETSGGEYVVRPGDNLYRIAKNELGDGSRWEEIYELNKDKIKDPSLIYSQQRLVLPGDLQNNSAEAETAVDADEQAKANSLAEQLHKKAEQAEPAVTAILTSMESDKAHLEGLDYRLKTIESLSRKIISDSHDMEISLEESASGIYDNLRYTMIIEDENYSETVKNLTDNLIASGYKIHKFKNYWIDSSRSYQGINAIFTTPNGLVFELQFHTPDSYDTKESKTHYLYEIIRNENSTPEEVAAATAKQDELFNQIPIPPGVEDLTY